jgi:FkbM family methyltransferase
VSATSIHRLIERIGDAVPVEVVMDVGAHTGTDSLPVAQQFPHVTVFAVEPTPSLAERLRESSRDLPNYTVIEAAIDVEETERTFNLFPKGLGGYNSLNEFVPGVEGLPPVTERLRLRTKRLDTVCDEHGIDCVDVLHVDAQGSDLRVLASLGERLDRVKAGAIEVSNRVQLYLTSVHREEARAFLEARGFVIVDIQPVNLGEDEQDMFFVHRRVEPSFLARTAPRLLYRVLVVRCALLVALGAEGGLGAGIRARVALRTRARRLSARLRG